MTDREIIELLTWTGHLEYPFGKRSGSLEGHTRAGVLSLSLSDSVIEKAIASYQDFMMLDMERLCQKHHYRVAQADGVIGPATSELFEQDRCGCPDYGEPSDHYQPKVGTGNWQRCHGIGDFHAAKVHVDERLMPSFLKPVFDTVWKGTIGAYQEIGLQLIRVENKSGANIAASFVSGSRGWIGLAIVGYNKSCSSQIWCQYLARYRPSNIVGSWTELFLHEIGHNCGLQHTRGGIMNPSLITGLPPTWKGDVSRPTLARYYGGEPIPTGPEADEYWITQTFESSHGRKVSVPLVPPMPVGEEEFHA